ncbi:MAG: hypothetical protein ACREDF_07770, partial [Thermoplasmata archaeon]
LRDRNYRTRLGATLGLSELGYVKAVDDLEKVAEAEPIGYLRSYARRGIREIREKHAESAKKIEQQEELDKLKDENKELRAKFTQLEARVNALGKKRKR